MVSHTESFSDKWWDVFLTQTNNFSETKVFKNVISNENIDFLNSEIMNAINFIYTLKAYQYGFRVYIDGEEQTKNYLLSMFENSFPFQDEKINDYFKRIFPNKKFGFIINRIEKFSETIVNNILIKIQPLINKIGTPFTGVGFTLFIGNYGWTPLGIHQDHKGNNVIHFHLGPGPKVMYNWDETLYNTIANGEQNNKNIEGLLPEAESYSFETGDIYFMPWNKFHVGFSDEFSVSLTVWFNNPTRENYVNKILESINLQYVKEDSEILYSSKNLVFKEISNQITLDENIKKKSFNEVLDFLQTEYSLSILSNGSLSSTPVLISENTKFDTETDYTIFKNKKITTPYPFRTYFKKNNDELVVFARGRKINIKYHKELIVIIEKLNNNEPIDVNKLLKKISLEWPLEAGLYFLGLLYDNCAIKIVN